ncbi:MAG: FIST C-terminal domain-containing protein [Verrucomicrobia bacterium]|nr:FIST C-terminal domain-containing protein [Verrucomicrobiota bacterium]MDE3099037.1 FIST C-terminal domain-containing protein [Verrucomicrobiota bacterium]
MSAKFSIAAHWQDGFDEDRLGKWAADLWGQLDAPAVSLGLVFMAPDFFPQARQVLEILRVRARIPLLAGCSSTALICNGSEVENASGVVLALYWLPDAEVRAVRFTQQQVQEAGGNYWRSHSGLEPDGINGWLAFIDPFHLDAEGWLETWNESFPKAPVYGGLASGIFSDQTTQIYLDGEVFEDGGVAIGVGGAVKMEGVISQGCTPIGETWTLTRVEHNLIRQIANRPAYAVLAETFQKLPPDEQQKARGNLLIGLVVNEYLEDFQRGDFLVRNLIGGDPASGVLAVGAQPRAGQMMQFQRRDAAAANEDMSELLARRKKEIGGGPIYGGCLCCCNGRGRNLFGRPNHDADLVQQLMGPTGLAGFFCNGEIGPVGGRNYLHGFTASLALFVKK